MWNVKIFWKIVSGNRSSEGNLRYVTCGGLCDTYNSATKAYKLEKEIFLCFRSSLSFLFIQFMRLWPCNTLGHWTGVWKWMPANTKLCFAYMQCECVHNFWHKQQAATDFKEWNRFGVAISRHLCVFEDTITFEYFVLLSFSLCRFSPSRFRCDFCATYDQNVFKSKTQLLCVVFMKLEK